MNFGVKEFTCHQYYHKTRSQGLKGPVWPPQLIEDCDTPTKLGQNINHWNEVDVIFL